MRDLDMLKFVADRDASDRGNWTAADQAVHNVLAALHTVVAPDWYIWALFYDAVKSAYVADPDWGDDE